MAERKKMALIAAQGSLDWAYPPFILASTGAAMDMDEDVRPPRGSTTLSAQPPPPSPNI